MGKWFNTTLQICTFENPENQHFTPQDVVTPKISKYSMWGACVKECSQQHCFHKQKLPINMKSILYSENGVFCTSEITQIRAKCWVQPSCSGLPII